MYAPTMQRGSNEKLTRRPSVSCLSRWCDGDLKVVIVSCRGNALYPSKRLLAVETPRVGPVEVVKEKHVQGADLGHSGQLGQDPGMLGIDELHGGIVDD